jgi:hypothetical protein
MVLLWWGVGSNTYLIIASMNYLWYYRPGPLTTLKNQPYQNPFTKGYKPKQSKLPLKVFTPNGEIFVNFSEDTID